MFLPKLDAFLIFFNVDINTASTIFFSKAVPHGCDWSHGQLVVHVLSLDGNDAILVVNVFVGVLVAHAFIFFLDLLLAVEDDIQVLGLADRALRQLFKFKPSTQDRQLFLISCLVAASQKLLIFGCDFDEC